MSSKNDRLTVNADRSPAWEIESASPDASRVSLRDFLHIVFKRKHQILLFFGGCFIAVVIGTLLVTPEYRTTAQVLVKLGRENLYVPATGTSMPYINLHQEEQVNSEIEILRSRTIAEKVLAEIGPESLYPDLDRKSWFSLSALSGDPETVNSLETRALEKLEKKLQIEAIKKANVIEVSFEHPDPELAADFVNALVAQYLDRRLEILRTPQSHEFFKDQSEFLRDKLNRTEARFQALKEQHNVTDLKNQQALMLTRITEARADFDRAASREAELARRIANLGDQLAKLPKSIPQSEQSNSNEFLISNLESRLAELQIEEQRLSAKYTDENRTLKTVREEIALIRKQIAEKEAKRYGKTSYGISTTYTNLHEDQLRSEAELSSVKAKQASLREQLGAYEKELAALNQVETTLNQLTQELNVDRDNYRLYLSKFEESRIQTAMDSQKIAGVSLLEPAHVPFKPVKPRVLLNLALGLLLGLFGALGLAFFLEFVADDLEKTEDVEAAFDLPVLAVMPELRR
jgi:uncharacterized protein involved in exopolysaccharide biosynthesis